MVVVFEGLTMATTIRLVWMLALATAAVSPAVTHAQDSVPAGLSSDEEARMRFELGRRYYDTGRFADAAREFEESARLSGRTELLYNLFLAYRDAGEDEHAIDTLRRYIESLDAGERRTQLESRLHVMEERFHSTSTAEPTGTATEPTGTATETTGTATETTGTTTAATDATQPASSGAGGLGVVPWLVIGVGGALIVGSVVTGVLALDARSTLDRMCTADGACPAGYESTRSSGQALSITTDVLWIAGGLAAATGIVLAIVDATSGHADAPVTAGLFCTDRGCLASAQGSF